MESFLPQWVVDLSVVCSIVGLLWTAVVWLETRRIRHEFLVRIRLPDMIKELRDEAKNLLAALAEWEQGSDHTKTHSAISTLKGVLMNLKHKVAKDDLKQVLRVIDLIDQRSMLFIVRPVATITKDHAWALSGDVSTLLALLGQRVKDIKWG